MKVNINNLSTFKKMHKTVMQFNTLKQIFIYLLRVFVLMLLCRKFMFLGFFAIFNFLIINTPGEDNWIFVAGFLFMLYPYLIQKLCGLFKSLDKLNFFLSFIVIILTDILFNYSMAITVQINPTIKIAYYKADFLFILSVLFLVYSFFNFLSKKFILFQKIGYYTSIEFYKTLINKIKVKI